MSSSLVACAANMKKTSWNVLDASRWRRTNMSSSAEVIRSVSCSHSLTELSRWQTGAFISCNWSQFTFREGKKEAVFVDTLTDKKPEACFMFLIKWHISSTWCHISPHTSETLRADKTEGMQVTLQKEVWSHIQHNCGGRLKSVSSLFGFLSLCRQEFSLSRHVVVNRRQPTAQWRS